jgi:hypothetical protein
MKILRLALAAALAFGTMSVAAAPAAAQGRHSGEMRHDGERHDMGRDDNVRHDRGDRANRYDRRHAGRHHARGHGQRWRTRQVCRSVWRHGDRRRVCRTVRYRR